jgi:hypothetical protein
MATIRVYFPSQVLDEQPPSYFLPRPILLVLAVLAPYIPIQRPRPGDVLDVFHGAG